MKEQRVKSLSSDDILRDTALMDMLETLRETLDEQARCYAAELNQDERQFEREVDAAKAKLFSRMLEFLNQHEWFQMEERHVAAFAGLLVKNE